MNLLQGHDAEILDDFTYLIGIDEAGRGALAGPVYAGACVLSSAFFESRELIEFTDGINDSKQVTPEQRVAFFEQITEFRQQGLLDFEVAAGSVQEISELNILGATRLAMQRALEGLARRTKDWVLPTLLGTDPLFLSSDHTNVRCLVDGRPLKPFPYLHDGIVKGDGKSLSIAIASIAAKVSRDREMKTLAECFPGYGFEVHKGYGTKAHRAAILQCGPCNIHRELFLRKILS